MKLGETVKQVIDEKPWGNLPQGSEKLHRGPAKTPGSYRNVAERVGIPEQTIRHAEQHVAAVDKSLETAALAQSQAIAQVGGELV